MCIKRRLLLVAITAGVSSLAVTPVFAFPKLYVLKSPHREHCKAHYVEKTRVVRVHGHRRQQIICVYVAGKSPSAPGIHKISWPQIHFTITNHDGWEYAGILEFPHTRAAFSPDVSSSPPGYARLKIAMSAARISNLEFHDLNPGRPNGPTLEIESGHLVYPIQHPLAMEEGEPLAGPCEWAGMSIDVTGEHESPFGLELRCWLLDREPTEMTGDAHEAEIDVLATELRHTIPWYEFGFKFPGEASDTGQCDYYVTPSGQVMEAAEFTRFECEAANVSIIR